MGNVRDSVSKLSMKDSKQIEHNILQEKDSSLQLFKYLNKKYLVFFGT